ncbi:unnamed protein product [Dicrocoelium dendriticum]|nr:unnamed protein product [Dicrocoelium dendriticum]
MVLNSRITGELEPTSHVVRLLQHFTSVRPTLPRFSLRNQQVHSDLHTCPFVFVHVDAVCKPWTPPYESPFKVVARKEKYFVLDRNGSKNSVSLVRLKPAYVETGSNKPPNRPSPVPRLPSRCVNPMCFPPPPPPNQ